MLLLLASPTHLSTLSHLIHLKKGGEFARRHVPVNLRQILAAESAANDGFAYPFLTISLYLTFDSSRGVAIGHWILIGCLCMSSFYLCESLRPFLKCHSNRSSMFWHRNGCNPWFVLTSTLIICADTHKACYFPTSLNFLIIVVSLIENHTLRNI